MAITPEQALGDKLKAEQEVIDTLEKRIDDFLLKEWSARMPVHYQDLKGITLFVINEVQRRFQAAGWKVVYSEHQVDGQCLTFSTAATEPNLD